MLLSDCGNISFKKLESVIWPWDCSCYAKRNGPISSLFIFMSNS